MVDPRTNPESPPRIPTGEESIVDFDRPPVTEVICGIGYTEIKGFDAPHMGLFWNMIRREFPVAEVRDALGPPGEPPGLLRLLPGPAPLRFFLRSQDRTELVQVQPNRVLYNWLKTDAGNPYPRYRGVMKRFDEIREFFGRFLRENGFPPPSIRELRFEYLNSIHHGQGWEQPADVSRLFPDFRFRKPKRRYLREPLGFNITSRHPVTDQDSHLDLSLRSAQRADERRIVLQLSVIGKVADPSESEIKSWFDMARQAIDLSFVDLASSYAKENIWGIHER